MLFQIITIIQNRNRYIKPVDKKRGLMQKTGRLMDKNSASFQMFVNLSS